LSINYYVIKGRVDLRWQLMFLMRVIRPFFRKKLYIQAIFKKISRNIVFVNKIKLKFNNLLSLYDFEYRYIFFM